MRQRFLGLCIAPLLLCLLDNTLTLVGQPAEYWAGDRSKVDEDSPTFNHLLQISPLADIAGVAVWMGVFVAIILLLPDTPALIVSIAVTIGHTSGAASWILDRYHFGYQLTMALTLLSASLLGVDIRWAWKAAPAGQYRLVCLPPVLRWLLIAGLFAIGVYLFLWPRTP
jgi:hypothetical protein